MTEVMPTIKEDSADPEQEESDETISISSTSTAAHFEQYGVSETLNMTVYNYEQLSDGYSQLAAARPKLAPGKIAKALAQLPSGPHIFQ